MMFPMGDFPVLDPQEFHDATGIPDYHSVHTIELGELIEGGIFTWERVDWSNAAFSPEQHARVCKAFEARFWLREIGITPASQWMRYLAYTMNYEICPKYNPLYEQLAEYNPLQNGGEYGLERYIDSDFPETLLNGSKQDYAASLGRDREWEKIGLGNITDDVVNYIENWKSVDRAILDELETLFSSMYTTNANGW